MLIPMLLVFLFWRYFPMYELLGCFKVSDEVKPVAEQLFAGFSNFKVLLVGDGSKTTEFWRAMRNTFLLSFYGLCFGFPMPIILALFFNEIKSNIARSVYQVMTYLPKFMSTVVMTSLVTMLVKQGSLTSNMGIVSQLLCNLGLISQEVAQGGLLNQPGFFRAIYQISGIWESAGYDSIVRLSITGNTSTGAIYFSPYFDGVNDIERMPLMRVDWVRKLLDGEGEFTADACGNTAEPVYEPYMPTEGVVEIEVVNAQGTDVEVISKKAIETYPHSPARASALSDADLRYKR